MSLLVVLCTCPDRAHAERIATALVERRLAACASIVAGVTSIYRWQDAIEQADEVQLVIKTTEQRYPAVEQAIVELHPYELPEVVAVEAAAGLSAYLDWVGAATAVDR